MGNEITDPENINSFKSNRNQIQTEFFHRLQQSEPKERIKCHETLQNDLCMLQIENCRTVESNDFSERELESVIRSLKNGKSRKVTVESYCGKSLRVLSERFSNKVADSSSSLSRK